MTSRSGFSLIEMLIVIILAGIVAGTALPNLGRSLADLRLQKAATVVAADLQLAHSMAARRRQPILFVVDATNRSTLIRSWPTTTTIYATRRFDSASDLGVQQMTSSISDLVMYPSGLASAPITITLLATGKTRVITMSRAGQVRIQ